MTFSAYPHPGYLTWRQKTFKYSFLFFTKTFIRDLPHMIIRFSCVWKKVNVVDFFFSIRIFERVLRAKCTTHDARYSNLAAFHIYRRVLSRLSDNVVHFPIFPKRKFERFCPVCHSKELSSAKLIRTLAFRLIHFSTFFFYIRNVIMGYSVQFLDSFWSKH